MTRLTLLATLALALLVTTPASAEPSAAQTRRAQVVRMKPITARPMKPNAIVEIRKRRMTLRARGAARFTDRIGRRLGDAPF